MDRTTPTPRDAVAASYLENPDVEAESYDECLYPGDGRSEWLILTDEEADERTTEYIRESAWAFNASFLLAYVPDGVTEDVLQLIGEKCEDGNPSMLALIGDRFDEFASDAISADGRGHFLAGYDGDEVEIDHGGRTWYAYRVN